MLIDRDFIRGNLERFSAKRGDRESKQVIRNFLRRDGGSDILAWQMNHAVDIALTPMPDTGHPLNDWLTWFIDNIDEIIAAIKKILELFEGLSPAPVS